MPNENEGSNPPGDAPPPPPPDAVAPTLPIQFGGTAQTTNRRNEDAAATKRELHILEKINIFGQLGLVVLGIIAASIYGCQLQQMKKTVENTEAYFKTDERAWVEIEPIKPILLDNTAKFGATFTCDIYPKNVGKTVATDVVVKASEQFGGEEFGNNRSMMANAQDKYLGGKFTEMGTGNPVHVPKNPVPKVLAPNTISAAPFRLTCQAPQVFKDGQMIHYLIGRIDYCDQFRVKHWLKFCYFVVNARGEIWNCQEGNDGDRNQEGSPDPACTAT